jgi:hypothetical protein
MGIISDRNSVRYTLASDDGEQFTVDVQALAPGQTDSVKWVWPYRTPPLLRQNRDLLVWHTYLPESRTVYCTSGRFGTSVAPVATYRNPSSNMRLTSS